MALKEFSIKINKLPVRLCCDSGLKAQARFVLGLLAEEVAEGAAELLDGFTLQVGWSFYLLKEEDNGFSLLCPDYTGDPFKDRTSDLTLPLTVLAQQVDILHRAEQTGQLVSFQDTLIVLKGALEAEEIYLQRSESNRSGDSGWFIGLPEQDAQDPAQLELLQTWQLLNKRPVLLQLLLLPTGCIVVVSGNEILEAVDGDDNRIL